MFSSPTRGVALLPFKTKPPRLSVVLVAVAVAFAAVHVARGALSILLNDEWPRGLRRLSASSRDFFFDATSRTSRASPPRLGPRCDDDARFPDTHSPSMTAAEVRAMTRYVRGEHVVGAEAAATTPTTVVTSESHRNATRERINRWNDGDGPVYLEWGVGGSTSVFGVQSSRAHSVEHAEEWCEIVRGWPELRCMRRSRRWRLLCHAPRTKLAKWGYPAAADDDAFEDDMRPYVQAPGTFGVDAFDVVLIDGRYRNACAYAVIPFLRDDSIVAWHDWDDASWRRLLELEDAAAASIAAGAAAAATAAEPPPSWPSERQYWRAASALFTPIERVDSLVFFRVKDIVRARMKLVA